MKLVADLLQLAGLIVIAAAIFAVWPIAGIIAAGLILILIGITLDPRLSRSKD